jgi:threonine dehydrogenase-like Zn-dependent dehydrogenase
MRRIVTMGPRQVEVREDAQPVAGPGEVVIGVEVVGLCGSDLHFYLGDYPYVNYPRTQGHEFVGLVEALGEGVSGLTVGQRVAVEPLIPCGSCFPCRRGRRNCCTRMKTIGVQVDGGLAEHIALPAANLFPTGDLPADVAVLSEPLSIAEHAVARSRLQPGDQVVVFGAGPVGQAILVAARDRGARVMAVDPLPSRLELATAFGAESVVSARDADPEAAIAAWTDQDGPACVFEASGVPAVLEQAVRAVAASGTIVVVGLSTKPAAIPLISFTRKELDVLGSRNNLGVFARAVETVQRHAPGIGRLVTHRYPLEAAGEALDMLAEHPEETGKVVVEVGGAG